MIGDWVSIYSRPEKINDIFITKPITEPSLVTRWYIRADVENPDTGVYNDHAVIQSEIPLNDILPIPLTAEILEKNGENINRWQDVAREWTWYNEDGDYIELTLHAEGETCKDGFFVSANGGEYKLFTIHYVHELQHALRLCGIEKDIVL